MNTFITKKFEVQDLAGVDTFLNDRDSGDLVAIATVQNYIVITKLLNTPVQPRLVPITPPTATETAISNAAGAGQIGAPTDVQTQETGTVVSGPNDTAPAA
jgi:hypothetical protein